MPSKKDFSSKQEKMVADYMGWKVVAGSGSRPFTPGDVSGEHFLVECKTHITEKSNIIFYKKHWVKISEEARALNRYPVLIVDNGTQKSQNTWVMIPQAVLSESGSKIEGIAITSTSNNTITFNKALADSLYKNRYEDIRYFTYQFDSTNLAIMPLSDFRNLYVQEFEC